MTDWKAHNSGGCMLNPGGVSGQIWVSVETQGCHTTPQRRLFGMLSGFCALVEAFLSPGGVTCACSATWGVGSLGGLSFAWCGVACCLPVV